MKPDSVADCGWRPLCVNHHSIPSCHSLTAAVHVTINSQQKVINNVTATSLPAVIIQYTPICNHRQGTIKNYK